jgi:hypothetical protein
VHSFCRVLAPGIAGWCSFADRVAGVAAIPTRRHYRESNLCFDPGRVVSSRAFARLEESLKANGMELSNANDDPLLRMRKGV